MAAEHDVENGSVNIAPADHRSANKDSFLSYRRTRLLPDSDIGTARSANTSLLGQRLPFPLDGLNDTLRHFRSAGVIVKESGNPRRHGTSVSRQGYTSPHLLFGFRSSWKKTGTPGR